MFLAVVCGLFGLAVGSFLNVVIHRVPRRESVSHPRSRCPQCETQLAMYDNIPLASWLILGGRCRTCKTKIPIRYPLVELGTAALFVAAAIRFGADWALPAFCLFLAALFALALIDLEWFLLPSKIIYPTLLASAPLLLIAAAAGHHWHSLRSAVIGSLAAFGVFFLLNLVYPKGMAFGDVRLSAVVGLYLGWLGLRTAFVGLFLAFLTASIVGITLIIARRADRKSPVPFGVFLAIGAGIAVFAGAPIVRFWMG